MSCCSGDGEVTEVKAKPANRPSLSEATQITRLKGASSEALIVTQEATEYIEQLLKKEKKEGYGLKIEVAPGGCAGFKYFMGFQEKPEDGDKAFEFHGVKIFLSLMSLGFLKGSTIEFVQSLEATGLKVNNPNATRACGCGKSFA